ncbi:hypothetical protein [Streptomyces sp. NPDC059816]|uniref:hypothetical protein n=1 Tax=Streptomyces sp. NPDC059816 TaxID=3346960 RepID=UPI00366912D6
MRASAQIDGPRRRAARTVGSSSTDSATPADSASRAGTGPVGQAPELRPGDKHHLVPTSLQLNAEHHERLPVTA